VAVHEPDYIKRMIQQLAGLLRRVLGLRDAGRDDAAIEELRRATEELLGVPWDVLGSVDPDTAGAMLGDPRKLVILARLVAEEADLLRNRRDAARARVRLAHARDLLRTSGVASDDTVARLDEIARALAAG